MYILSDAVARARQRTALEKKRTALEKKRTAHAVTKRSGE
jgi:hypothetical protein